MSDTVYFWYSAKHAEHYARCNELWSDHRIAPTTIVINGTRMEYTAARHDESDEPYEGALENFPDYKLLGVASWDTFRSEKPMSDTHASVQRAARKIHEFVDAHPEIVPAQHFYAEAIESECHVGELVEALEDLLGATDFCGDELRLLDDEQTKQLKESQVAAEALLRKLEERHAQ